jgi:hypothetical protein
MSDPLTIDDVNTLLALARKGLAAASNEASLDVLHKCSGSMLRFSEWAREQAEAAQAKPIEKATP